MSDIDDSNTAVSANNPALANIVTPQVTQPSENEFTDFSHAGQTGETTGGELVDDKNEIWQAELHKSPPKKNKFGLWVKKPGRPLVKSKYAGDSDKILSPEEAQSSEESAKIYAGAWGQMHTFVYGASGYDEKLLVPLEKGIAKYIKLKGDLPMPVEVEIVIGALGYTNLVARKPENINTTKKVFGGAWQKLKWFVGMNNEMPLVS